MQHNVNKHCKFQRSRFFHFHYCKIVKGNIFTNKILAKNFDMNLKK